jgi:hypothetical protein
MYVCVVSCVSTAPRQCDGNAGGVCARPPYQLEVAEAFRGVWCDLTQTLPRDPLRSPPPVLAIVSCSLAVVPFRTHPQVCAPHPSPHTHCLFPRTHLLHVPAPSGTVGTVQGDAGNASPFRARAAAVPKPPVLPTDVDASDLPKLKAMTMKFSVHNREGAGSHRNRGERDRGLVKTLGACVSVSVHVYVYVVCVFFWGGVHVCTGVLMCNCV